jgi:hypothetical protein
MAICMPPTLNRLIATMLASLALVLASAAQAAPPANAEIAPGVEHRGPKVLSAAALGVSFTMPSGWVGVLPAGADTFLLTSAAHQGRILMRGAPLTNAEAQAMMSADIPLGDGLTLSPVGALRQAGGSLIGDYVLNGVEPQLSARIYTTVGKFGVGAAIIALGDADTLTKMLPTIAELSRSLRFSKPREAPRVSVASGPATFNLVGRRLTRFYSASGYSEKTVLRLCRDGSFQRHFDASSVSQLGTGGMDGGSSGHYTQQGNVLTLTYDNGSVASYDIAQENQSLLLNGKKWFQEPGDC